MEEERWEQYLQEVADAFTEQGEGNQREYQKRTDDSDREATQNP